MCRRETMLGNVLIALGAGLVLSMLIPRSIWTVIVGGILVLLGFLLGRRS